MQKNLYFVLLSLKASNLSTEFKKTTCTLPIVFCLIYSRPTGQAGRGRDWLCSPGKQRIALRDQNRACLSSNRPSVFRIVGLLWKFVQCLKICFAVEIISRPSPGPRQYLEDIFFDDYHWSWFSFPWGPMYAIESRGKFVVKKTIDKKNNRTW